MPGRVGLGRGARAARRRRPRRRRRSPGRSARRRGARRRTRAVRAEPGPARDAEPRARAGSPAGSASTSEPERTLMAGLWHSSRAPPPRIGQGPRPEPSPRRTARETPRGENGAASRGLGGRRGAPPSSAWHGSRSPRSICLPSRPTGSRSRSITPALACRWCACTARRAPAPSGAASAGELASRYHVLAADLHGHGGTSRLALYAPDAPGRRGRADAAAARRAALARFT